MKSLDGRQTLSLKCDFCGKIHFQKAMHVVATEKIYPGLTFFFCWSQQSFPGRLWHAQCWALCWPHITQGWGSTVTWPEQLGEPHTVGPWLTTRMWGLFYTFWACCAQSSLPGQPPVWADFPKVPRNVIDASLLHFMGGPPVWSSSCLSVLWAVSRESFNSICWIFCQWGWLSSGSTRLVRSIPFSRDKPNIPSASWFCSLPELETQTQQMCLCGAQGANVLPWMSVLFAGSLRDTGIVTSCHPLMVCGPMGSASGRISIKFTWLNTFYWGS